MSKTYAKIIDTTEYGSDLSTMFLEDTLEERPYLIIDGGREFKSFNNDILKNVRSIIDDYDSYDFDNYFKCVKSLVEYYVKKTNGKKFSPKEIGIIKKVLTSNYDRYYEENCTLTILGIIFGKEFDTFKLCGYSQGDVVYLLAPKDTPAQIIDDLECYYFDKGVEVMIHDSDTEPTCAEDIDGYCEYYNSYDIKVKEKIATQFGCAEEDIVLYKVKGYRRIAEYELVE